MPFSFDIPFLDDRKEDAVVSLTPGLDTLTYPPSTQADRIET